MSKNEDEVLAALAGVEACGRWCRPMDLGAFDGSHHSATLTRLARKGVVERKKIHAIYCYFGTTRNGKRVTRCCCKGHCEYRLAERAAVRSEPKRRKR